MRSAYAISCKLAAHPNRALIAKYKFCRFKQCLSLGRLCLYNFIREIRHIACP